MKQFVNLARDSNKAALLTSGLIDAADIVGGNSIVLPPTGSPFGELVFNKWFFVAQIIIVGGAQLFWKLVFPGDSELYTNGANTLHGAYIANVTHNFPLTVGLWCPPGYGIEFSADVDFGEPLGGNWKIDIIGYEAKE